MSALPAVSLFSGGGGLDYGIARAGFATRLAVEKERYAVEVLSEARRLQVEVTPDHHYLSDCTIVHRDIAEVSDSEALMAARLRPGEAALLVGGPPCVTFSVAGRREGLTSETGMLYRHFIRLVRAFAPRSFIFENVKGILSASSAESPSMSAFDVIFSELHGLGYALTWRLVDAADYGVPQHRHRVIILGHLGASPLDFPPPTHAHQAKLGLFASTRPWLTVRDAIGGLPPAVPLGSEPLIANHTAKRHGEKTVASYRATAPGRRNQTYKRDKLLWDAPSKTIRAQGKEKADGSGQKNSSHQPIHPDEPRQLTPRECACIQTFPSWYPFPNSLVNAYRIIGDAVPCELAFTLASSIRDQLAPRSLVLT